jgi:prepilin-type N-terminal cleavage/methylation domain-containing protein
MTLIELLCVFAIIAILAALYLPGVARAYHRIRGAAEELEAPDIADMLRTKARAYCAAHPHYQFDSKSDFEDKCELAPKCRSWVRADSTQFVPFNYLDPATNTVLTVYLGPRHRTVYAFTKGNLAITPER